MPSIEGGVDTLYPVDFEGAPRDVGNEEYLDSSDKKEYVGPISRSRAKTQLVNKMVVKTNALVNEHFNISEVEN